MDKYIEYLELTIKELEDENSQLKRIKEYYEDFRYQQLKKWEQNQ